MDLPVRYFLIDQSTWKGLLALKIISIHDVLRLSFSLHQFTSVLTDSIRQSFLANQDNEKYFKMLPTEQIKSFDISLYETEQHVLYLFGILQQYPPNYDQYINVGFHHGLQLWLYYSMIYSMYNFENNFAMNYNYWKSLSLQSHEIPSSTSTYIPDPARELKITDDNSEETSEEIIEPEEDRFEIESGDDNVINAMQFINESIKLSPNSLTTYYISRCIDDILHTHQNHLFDLKVENATLSITLEPLINLHLMMLSKSHFSNILGLLGSFNFSPNEYNAKLRILVNQMLYIVFEYLNGRSSKESVILPLRVIEFLIFIYTTKAKGHTIPDVPDIISMDKHILELVNETVFYQFQHFNQKDLEFGRINIFHSNQNTTKIENKLDLSSLLANERYLLEINREEFINNVYSAAKDSKNKSQTNNKLTLILNYGNSIDIDQQFLNKNNTGSTWLNYETITPTQTQLLRNNISRIITPEYYQLLQLEIMPKTAVDIFIKNIDPKLAKYADIIIHYIQKDLSLDIKTGMTVSTLHLLNNNIRPYLPVNTSVDTELFILYRCVIPYLYDFKYCNHFIDYFH